MLAAGFERLGGEVHVREPVDRIVVEGRRTNGVQVDGARISAGAVLSTTSAMATCRQLLDERAVSAALLRKVDAAPLSQKAVSVQLGLQNRVDAESHFMGVIPELPSGRHRGHPSA